MNDPRPELASRPTLAVLYGQTDAISTSFQTTQLARHLEPWLESVPRRVGPASPRPWRNAARRFTANYLRPLLKRPRTDYVLYANDGVVDLARWSGQRLIYWYDAPADWSVDPPHPGQFVQWLRYRNVRLADWVFAVSHTQVELGRKLRPGREDGVVYLPVGVDCEVFDPTLADRDAVRQRYGLPDKPIVGYLGYVGIVDGRFSGEPIAEMAPALLREHDAHFFIVGRGPGLEAFKRSVAQAGVADAFTFSGFVPDELLVSSIAVMDVAIDTLEPGFHSLARSETKLKQYMAMGRACAATAIGENVVDLENGDCGVLVEPGSEGLREGVSRLLADAELRRRLGDAARRRAVEVYDWRCLARRLASSLGLAGG